MKLRNEKFDGFLRKIIPSTAILSYNRAFKIAGKLNDLFMNFLVPEFKNLPPNHLRVRVGVGNKIFNNQVLCMNSGKDFWIDLFAENYCSLNSKVTEIGCGYGRKAIHLRDYNVQGRKFTGKYTGIDIDEELLKWAEENISGNQNFTFQLSSHKSKTYSPDPKNIDVEYSEYLIDLPDQSQDLVYSTSLFTHLLEDELINYMKESLRILKPNKTMQMNVFLFDFMKEENILGSRFNFNHSIGNAYVENSDFPEAAVAYTREFLKSTGEEIGFSKVEFVTDLFGKLPQSYLRCIK